MRHTRRLLRNTLVPVFLALEKQVAQNMASQQIWRIPSASAEIDLEFILKNLNAKGILPEEQPLMRSLMPKEIEELDGDLRVAEHLLPAALKPGMKRTMDVLADWPWVTHKDLSGLLGVTAQRTSQLTIPLVKSQLACRIYMQGRERLALSEWGWAVLARRDRTSVGRLRSQWDVETVDGKDPKTWREVFGRRSRLLARNSGAYSISPRLPCQVVEAGQGPQLQHANCWSRLTRLPGTSSTTTRRGQFIPMPLACWRKETNCCPSSWSGSVGR